MNLTRLARVAQQSQSRARITAAGALAILIALAYASMALIAAQRETHALEESLSALKDQMAVLQVRDDTVQKESAATQQVLAEKSQAIAKLERLATESLGFLTIESKSRETLSRSLAARDQIEQLAGDGAKRRQAVTVQYYPADFDRHFNKNLILPRLDRYGFKLEKVGSRVAQTPMNAVWCGAGVNPDDVRLAVFTLMASGVEVKAVRQYRDQHPLNNQVVLIGVDPDLNDEPALSVEEIIALGDFRREQLESRPN